MIGRFCAENTDDYSSLWLLTHHSWPSSRWLLMVGTQRVKIELGLFVLNSAPRLVSPLPWSATWPFYHFCTWASLPLNWSVSSPAQCLGALRGSGQMPPGRWLRHWQEIRGWCGEESCVPRNLPSPCVALDRLPSLPQSQRPQLQKDGKAPISSRLDLGWLRPERQGSPSQGSPRTGG